MIDYEKALRRSSGLLKSAEEMLRKMEYGERCPCDSEFLRGQIRDFLEEMAAREATR